MKPLYRLTPIILLALCFSCKNAAVHDQVRDTAPAIKKDTMGESGSGAERSCFIEKERLDMPDHSLSITSQYLFPTGPLQHDTSFYLKENWLILTRKSTKITDSLKLDAGDFDNCPYCEVIIRNLTDSLRVHPLFIQLVMQGEDLTDNTFIGYRDGKLTILFTLGDTESNGVNLQRGGDSTLYAAIFGIDEIVGSVVHNCPVSIDLRTFTASHPLAEKQYIGFKTVAAQPFRAYRVTKGGLDSAMVSVNVGDAVTIDTFYRSRQKVRLLVADSVPVEIKLATAKKKLRHPAAAG
jgi:hypothetical protein